MVRIRTLLMLLGLPAVLAVAVLTTAPDASAASCGGVATTVVGCDATNSDKVEDNGVWALLLMVLNIMTAGVGILAVGGIVYGAFLYTTSEDKADQTNKAKGIITNVIIGLVAFMLLWAGLNYLVPGGALQQSTGKTLELSRASTGSDSGGGSGDASGSGGGGGGSDNPSKTPTIDDIALKNFRDASTSTSGDVLKKGMLLRSPALGSLGPTDAKQLGQILTSDGIIIDLRTDAQRGDNPDKPVPGVTNRNIPIEGVLDTTPMVTDATRRSQLGKALKLAANASGPVLVHCAAGKDRTGWMVAMIMYAAGATDAQVMNEYLKSNEEAIDGGVKAEWLRNGLTAMRNQYGTAKGYMKAAGLSDAEIKKLASKFGA